MTLLHEEPTIVDVRRAELLFEEARQRRRRLRTIWITIATVAAVVLVSIGLTVHLFSSLRLQSAALKAQPAWPEHLRTGASLAYAFNDLQILSADTGVSHVLPLPAPYGSAGDLGMVSFGHSLLLNRGDRAWLYSVVSPGAPADLGRSIGVFRGPKSGEAWIWSQPCIPIIGCANYNASQMGDVRLIDSVGRQIEAPVALPGTAGWYPTGLAGSAGIVISKSPAYGNNEEEVWNPLTGQVVRVFKDANVIGAGGNIVVWTAAPANCTTRCTVHISNVRTGSEHTVKLPSGFTTTGDAVISPDSSTIAITAAFGGMSHLSDPEAVLLVGPDDLVARVLAGSEQATNPNLGPMALTWSTNGWLFSFTVGTTKVDAWRPGESRARVLPRLKLPEVTHLVNEGPSLTAL